MSPASILVARAPSTCQRRALSKQTFKNVPADAYQVPVDEIWSPTFTPREMSSIKLDQGESFFYFFKPFTFGVKKFSFLLTAYVIYQCKCAAGLRKMRTFVTEFAKLHFYTFADKLIFYLNLKSSVGWLRAENFFNDQGDWLRLKRGSRSFRISIFIEDEGFSFVLKKNEKKKSFRPIRIFVKFMMRSRFSGV